MDKTLLCIINIFFNNNIDPSHPPGIKIVDIVARKSFDFRVKEFNRPVFIALVYNAGEVLHQQPVFLLARPKGFLHLFTVSNILNRCYYFYGLVVFIKRHFRPSGIHCPFFSVGTNDPPFKWRLNLICQCFLKRGLYFLSIFGMNQFSD